MLAQLLWHALVGIDWILILPLAVLGSVGHRCITVVQALALRDPHALTRKGEGPHPLVVGVRASLFAGQATTVSGLRV